MSKKAEYTPRNSADVICNLMSWAMFKTKLENNFSYKQEELNELFEFINPAIRNLFESKKFGTSTIVDLNSLLYICITSIYSNKDYIKYKNALSDKLFNIYTDEKRLDIILEKYNLIFNIKDNYIEEVPIINEEKLEGFKSPF